MNKSEELLEKALREKDIITTPVEYLFEHAGGNEFRLTLATDKNLDGVEISFNAESGRIHDDTCRYGSYVICESISFRKAEDNTTGKELPLSPEQRHWLESELKREFGDDIKNYLN